MIADYFTIGKVEYKATIENKYVQKGSANCQGVHCGDSPAIKYIMDAETITPIDKIMSLII